MHDEGMITDGPPPARIAAGSEIARLIDQKFSSRKEFATKIGITDKKVSDLVHGRKKMDADLAKRLADCFDLQPDFFWNLEEEYDAEIAESRSRESKGVGKNGSATGSLLEHPHNARLPLERFSVGDRSMELVAGTSTERIRELVDIFFR